MFTENSIIQNQSTIVTIASTSVATTRVPNEIKKRGVGIGIGIGKEAEASLSASAITLNQIVYLTII